MRRAITTIRMPASAAQFRSLRSFNAWLFVLAFLFVLSTIGATNLLAQPEGPSRDRDESRRGDRRGDRPPFGGGPPKIDLWRMLEFPSVRKELELTDAQLADIGRFRTEMRKPKPDQKTRAEWKKNAWEKLTEAERKEKFEKLRIESQKKREQYEAKLKEILDEKQFARMQQIQLQIRGLGALFDKEISDKIGLSPSQKDRIHESVRSSMREAMHDYFKTERAERKMSMRDKMHEIRPAVEAEALKVLTKTQAAKFVEMKGNAFKIPDEEIRRRGRPPKEKNTRSGPPRKPRGDQPDEEKECGAHRE